MRTFFIVTGLLISAPACDHASTPASTPAADQRAATGACGNARRSQDWTEQIAFDRSHDWGPIECTRDADCTAKPDGRCARLGDGFYQCTYNECFVDGECATSEACACGVGALGANVCVAAACHADADCGAGSCVPTPTSCSSSESSDFFAPFPVTYQCTSDGDACDEDADCQPCTPDKDPRCDNPGWCRWDAGTQRRVCAYSQCTL